MQGFFFAESKNGEKNVMKCADGVKNKIRPLFADLYDSLMFSYFDGIFGNAFYAAHRVAANDKENHERHA